MADEALTPVCKPALLSGLRSPGDLAHTTLLHEDMLPLGSFPTWENWLAAAGIDGVDASRGLRFSHTHLMLQAAMDGRGVALGQMLIIAGDVAAGRLVAPFSFRLSTGCSYYIVCLPAAADRPKIIAFREWVMEELNGPTGSREASAAGRS